MSHFVKAHHLVSEETIERYIRRELPAEERRIFEEHLLDCAECFDQIQLMERFVAGVRDAARAGRLLEIAPRRGMCWLVPALAVSLAVVLIGAGVWVATLRRSLEESEAARGALVRQLAQASVTTAQPVELAAGNLPIAVLNANRAAGSGSVLPVPPSAREIALWMDVEPGDRYRTFSVALLDETERVVETVQGLTRNSEGAVAVILPAAKLPVGRYMARLSSENPSRLLAQYNLRITAP